MKIIFVNGKSKCGCEMRFSDGCGEYSDIHEITLCETHSGACPAKMTPLPVERDQYGYWTHPVYSNFCDGREHVPTAEFNAWMEANGLEWTVDYRDEEDIDPAVDGCDISKWHPEAPAGEGWFVGSIHDSEDGAVCIWLRKKSEPSQEEAAIAHQAEQVKGDK